MKPLPVVFLGLVLSVALQFAVGTLQAQHREIFHQDDYTLIVLNEDSTLAVTTLERMVETFFRVYPVMAKQYNADAERQVTFYVDTVYDGVAEVDVATAYVRFNADWLRQYPEDIDVVTHEVMHLAQNYPINAGPWWLVEGIADYGRHLYGVNNACAGWALSPYARGQSYRDGYRVTASFLRWLEIYIKPGIVDTLNRSLCTRTYNDGVWYSQTGKFMDELWDMYARYSAELTVHKTKTVTKLPPVKK